MLVVPYIIFVFVFINFEQNGYWNDIHSDPDNVTETSERILATFGLNIYDGGIWQVALALMGMFYGMWYFEEGGVVL